MLIKCEDDFEYDQEGFLLQEMDLKNETALIVDEIMLDKLKEFKRCAV